MNSVGSFSQQIQSFSKRYLLFKKYTEINIIRIDTVRCKNSDSNFQFNPYLKTGYVFKVLIL
jgi:hypothetical protein